MEPREVVKKVKEGTAPAGWYVFPYRIGWALLGLASRLLALAAFAFGASVLLAEAVRNGQTEYWLTGGAVALGGLIFFWMVCGDILALVYAGSSMVVLADSGLVFSRKGRAVFYPYKNIRDLRMVYEHGRNRFPEKSLTFVDARTNEAVELARGRIFGPVHIMYQQLNSKL